MLLLPPLFAFVHAKYGVDYTQLGFALTAFNLTSATLQPATGFLVDRLGARIILILGLLVGASAITVAALVHSFWVLVAMFAVAGIGNTAYHPADYAILSHRVSKRRMGHAFSIHTFAGILGSAVAPASVLAMQAPMGWRGAFLGAAVVGFAAALLLMLTGGGTAAPVPTRPEPLAGEGPPPAKAGWALLLSPPILRNLLFFCLLAVASSGVQNYSVVALGALHGTAPSIATASLSTHLLMSAGGVLLGGVIATHIGRHVLVAAGGTLALAAMAFLIGFVDLPALPLVLIMAAGGLGSGIMMPSRDLIVYAATPPGSSGKVFGFVTTGFNIGGIVSPPVFGALMDHGFPRAIFLVTALCSLAAILTVVGGRSKQATAPAD
jgi:MFS transporter, FSR family, fosmidomycin resistance protein